MNKSLGSATLVIRPYAARHQESCKHRAEFRVLVLKFIEVIIPFVFAFLFVILRFFLVTAEPDHDG